FHGRESELTDILKSLAQDSPRIAILGGGGMGKTTLARVVLHHPDTASRFEHIFFVSAESANNSVELAALIGLHLGLDPGQDLTRTVVQYFAKQQPVLLILDNLETPWEPMHSRGAVEEFLSLLTDIKHLALIITMRGAERPGKVRWTHPFLPPLKPLSDDAAQQIFDDITDNPDESKDKTRLLRSTENMPLAVVLIAHLVDHEGIPKVLARWETERTAIFAAGSDRQSNLDASIALSLTSSRVTLGAKELLSLLSILPDGISDIELIQSGLPIQDVQHCKAVLLATSLAYNDNKRRLKALTPIREYMTLHHPCSHPLTQAIRKHFHAL
ncbi:P-loop containing nucleoside triphosphate hydrolase protein, partial [Mycena polygramma]